MKNKVTSNLSEEQKQQKYLNARTSDWYDHIWKTVGKCVFCDLKEKYILHEENGVVLTINIYPYIDGHLMAIPRRHVSSPKELSQLEWETMRKFTYLAKKLMRKAYGHKRMWTLIREGGAEAQMTVTDHLHMQLIPFDSPDLCKWNYRELNFTPLENVEKYKKLAKDFAKNSIKFEKDYSNFSKVSVVCDLVIVNNKDEILFQERKKEYKFYPDILTLPGGHVENFNSTLEEELSREVFEEVGIKINPKDLSLIDSQFSNLMQVKKSKYLNSPMPYDHKFVWNTYKLNLKVKIENSKIKSGDDCEKIVWINIEAAIKHERISSELKERLKKINY